jgi:hypothetical protein
MRLIPTSSRALWHTNQGAPSIGALRPAILPLGIAFFRHEGTARHTCITKLAEGQASEQTIMAIAGHVSRKMLEHYSHIRMEAKRAALDAIAQVPIPAIFEAGSHQIPHQVGEGQNQQVANSLN